MQLIKKWVNMCKAVLGHEGLSVQILRHLFSLKNFIYLKTVKQAWETHGFPDVVVWNSLNSFPLLVLHRADASCSLITSGGPHVSLLLLYGLFQTCWTWSFIWEWTLMASLHLFFVYFRKKDSKITVSHDLWIKNSSQNLIHQSKSIRWSTKAFLPLW